MTRRCVLASFVSILALVLPSLVSAHRAAPPRCPSARPQDGQSCRYTAMTCSFHGTHEGGRGVVCRCSHTDHGLAWACEAAGEVIRE